MPVDDMRPYWNVDDMRPYWNVRAGHAEARVKELESQLALAEAIVEAAREEVQTGGWVDCGKPNCTHWWCKCIRLLAAYDAGRAKP